MIRYLKIHGSKGWKPKQYCGACEDVTEEVAKIKAFMKKSATEHIETAFLYSEAKREIEGLKAALEVIHKDAYDVISFDEFMKRLPAWVKMKKEAMAKGIDKTPKS